MKISSKYVNLSELPHEFTSGLIIVGDTLFDVTDMIVTDSYQLDGRTIEEKVISARTLAHVDGRTLIVYDDNDMYEEYTVADLGELVPGDADFEDDDYDDYDDRSERNFEHFMDN